MTDVGRETKELPGIVYPVAAYLIIVGLAGWYVTCVGDAGQLLRERLYVGFESTIFLGAGVALWANWKVARWLVLACAITASVDQLAGIHGTWPFGQGSLLSAKVARIAWSILLTWGFSAWYWRRMSLSEKR